MISQERQKSKMTAREKLRILAATGLFAAVGAALGIVAFYQHWLG